MKKKTLLCIGLASVLTIGAAVTTIAAPTNSQSRRGNGSCCSSSMREYRERGHVVFKNILVEKFGVSEDEIQTYYDEGKSLGTLAIDKNIDLEEFKTELTARRDAEVEAALEAGDITEEEAATMKENFRSHMEDFDFTSRGMRGGHRGNFKNRNGNMKGHGRGYGRGQNQ